ncbi:MAG: thioredoxin family protein [Christensenella sp.]|uniref:glutaredoxin family protein n=1 Tax=Christensenella sp. TaxID=1935934 RepID=UPI002B20566A|nr:thioredoxin family protein [Christensenella sp.]MEA5004769.1 thioredoxin family protein [Christensenella sp.]
MAKHVKMIMMDTCPHCRRAFELMDELKQEHPEYAQVDIETIDERHEPEKTRGYDYWYVPTFFVDDEKILEGVPSKEKVEQVFIEALKA